MSSYTHAHAYMYRYLHTYIATTHAHIQTYIRTYIHTYIHDIYTNTHTWYVCMHVCMLMYVQYCVFNLPVPVSFGQTRWMVGLQAYEQSRGTISSKAIQLTKHKHQTHQNLRQCMPPGQSSIGIPVKIPSPSAQTAIMTRSR